MDEKLKASLLLAYGIIREQEDLIYSLMALTTPLVKCLGPVRSPLGCDVPSGDEKQRSARYSKTGTMDLP